MAIQLPPQPWTEGLSFVVDETGLEYTYNGEVWVSEGEPLDLSVYATKLQLEELEVEVEALASTREAGVWTVATTPAVRPGEVHFATVSMTLADNEVYINNEDANGTVHNWGKLAVGDYLEVVQETKSRSVADYGLFTIIDDLGGEGIRHLKLAQQSGGGSLEGSSDVYIKVFHANNDLDMAELDARYALKSHTHNYASSSHTHNYASSSHTHSGLGGSVEAKHGSSTEWESYHGTYGCGKWFAHTRRSDGYKIEATYSKKLSELGQVKFVCNSSGLENKFGRAGVLIGSKSSDPNAYPLVVMTIWKTSQNVVYGYYNLVFEGTAVWVADPNMTLQSVPNLYWTWVGDAK